MSVFVPGEADGAIRNGTRIRKTNSEPRDTHADGAAGTVLSSVGPVELDGEERIGYFVEWDEHPGVPVFVADKRIEALP